MKSGSRLLLTQRNTALYLERARVRVEGERVVYDKAEGIEEKTFNIPYANIAILFMGQGTSLTQSAARLLSDEGVYIAFTGTGGTPLHYGSLTNYQVTRYMHDMYKVASSTEESLSAAKAAMLKRMDNVHSIAPRIWDACGLNMSTEAVDSLRGDLVNAMPQIPDHAKLMGVEGKVTKKLYQMHASSASVAGFARRHGEGRSDSKEAAINSRLDHGNYLAYGIAGSVLWSLGIPPSLSFFHGKTRAGGLVFDLADTFKDAIVLPMAFGSHKTEAEFRSRLIDAFQDHSVLLKCFEFMKDILDTGRR
jgi:CRISP-associated protein Cas1